MHKELKTEIEEVIEALKTSGKMHLAQQIEENWDKTCLEYSKKLNAYSPDTTTEPELAEAFEKELKRLEYSDESCVKILSSLEKRRILQTAPHIVPALSPRMLCVDWLSSLGVTKEEYYVVGMFSGIPFSNNFHSGRISNKNGEVNLFPSTMQDALVYKSKIPEKIIEVIATLPENLRKFLPEATTGASYTKWAIQSCQKIQNYVLNKKNLVYLDINEIATNYLLKVLANPSHVFYKIFFEAETRKKFTDTFPEETIFLAPIRKGKYEETEKLFFLNNKLKSLNREISLEDPRILIDTIRAENLCPSLFLTFTMLAFLNRFKCFGSFAQIEYLPEYQEKLARLDLMKEFKIHEVPTENLTLGAFKDEENLFPSDLVAENRKLIQDENYLFGELIVRMKNRLLKNYANKK